MMTSTPFWLRQGFRPFFLGAGVWAVLAMLHWLHMLAGIGGDGSIMPPLHWHRHEMIFGYGGAAMSGFLLTAIPNWTGRLPVRGLPLLALFLLWCAGRVASLTSALVGATTAGLIDAAFWAALVAVIVRELTAGKNMKNLPVAGLVALVGLGATLSQLGFDFAWRFGLASISMLILLVGGRVTPSFTRNWLVKQGRTKLPAPFATFDKLALASAAIALVAWIVGGHTALAGILLFIAGSLNLARLFRWQGQQTLAEPLVAVLHVGYGWTALGLVLLGVDGLVGGLPISAVHALTAGGVSTMTLAVMTRASLGHSGRPLHASPAIVAIYALVNLGAILRATADLWPMAYTHTIALAGGIWASGFLLYVLVFAPMWLRPRRKTGPSATQGEVSSSM